MAYALVTPMKDEEDYLPLLKNTVLSQRLKPDVWVLVDSGSNDDTFVSAKLLLRNVSWARVVRQQQFSEKGYSYRNFALAVNRGISEIRDIYAKAGRELTYIGKVDADVLLHEDYFEALVAEMDRDERLAIACGSRVDAEGRLLEPVAQTRENDLLGFNDIRLYRASFMTQQDGYPITVAPDTVILVKAILNGWRTRAFGTTGFRELRLGGSKTGIWKGYWLKGAAFYALGYRFPVVILNAIYQTVRAPPHHQGLAIVFGFLASAVRKDDRIDDIDVFRYFRNRGVLRLLANLAH